MYTFANRTVGIFLIDMTDTKEYILMSAYDMFLRNNYEAVTMSRISEVTKLTKGAIYHHFESKEELFKAVVDKYLLDSREQNLPVNISLKDYIQHTLDDASKKISLKQSLHSRSLGSSPVHDLSFLVDALKYYPGFAKIGRDFYLEGIRNWEIVLTGAKESGEIRKDVDPRVSALNFLAIFLSISASVIMNDSADIAFEKLKGQLDEMYRLIINTQ